MTLKETTLLMNSLDYKERFKAEYYQTKIRYERLKNMLKNWDRKKLEFVPDCPRGLYDLQIEAMEKYITVLEARAAIEKIVLLGEI